MMSFEEKLFHPFLVRNRSLIFSFLPILALHFE